MTISSIIQNTSVYEYKGDILCVRGDVLIEDYSPIGIVSLDMWRKFTKTGNLIQKGGNGRTSLIEFKSLPKKWQDTIFQHFGNPVPIANPLAKYFTIDATARHFYDNYIIPATGQCLELKHRVEYTANASVLNALPHLLKERTAMRRRMGGSVRGVWSSVVSDFIAFEKNLLDQYNMKHSLPKSERRLREKLNKYQKYGYESLISEKFGTANAQKVTQKMISLWNHLFATQKHKPTYLEIAHRYEQFLNGKVEIVNRQTGEVYDPTSDEFLPISESSVKAYLSSWENKIVNERLRTDSNLKFKTKFVPYHKLKDPLFAGQLISIDDRQPPFEYAPGQRMWFYNAVDLNSEAFIAWVYGDTKEGIILSFYRQLIRNIAEWGLNMPAGLEAEMSLNSSFVNTFLSPGVMFQNVRIEANNARGKKIERIYGKLRYGYEKKQEGWIARPFAQSERNQARVSKNMILSKDQIIDISLNAIEDYNNTLHDNQEKYPGMTRWEVWMSNQDPELKPINWYGILPFIGYQKKSTCKAGRVKLQYVEHVLGLNGEVATGDTLINLLKRIEGKQVECYWLDDNDGNILKAVVCKNGAVVCELMGDLAYNRAEGSRTEQDKINRSLMARYQDTVDKYVRERSRYIEDVAIIEIAPKEEPKNKFTIRRNGQKLTTPVVEDSIDDFEDIHPVAKIDIDTSLRSRF